MTQNQKSEKPKPFCLLLEKPSHFRDQCRQFGREKYHCEGSTVLLAIFITKTTVVKQTLNPTIKIQIVTILKMQTTETRGNHELSSHPVEHVAKRFGPQGNVILERMRQRDRLFGKKK